MEILIQKELSLHQFDIRTNQDSLSTLLHPEFLEVGKSGKTYNYQSIIESMGLEKRTDSSIHSQDYECIRLDNNAYLILYRTAVIDRKGAASDYAKRSSVWIYDGEEWKLRYHQGTPCAKFQFRKPNN